MTHLSFPNLHNPGEDVDPEIRDFVDPRGPRTNASRHIAFRRFEEVDRRLHPARGGRVLDIGTGWGYHLMALIGMGAEGVGIDLNLRRLEAGLDVARANGLDCPVIGADAAKLPFADGEFRAVSMVETIEHIFEADRASVFEECYRVLEPGGRLVLSTPNYGGAVERVRRLITTRYAAEKISRSAYHPDRYHLPWPVERLTDALRGVGFAVLRPRFFLFVIRPTPSAIVPLASQVEKVLESAPGVRRLALTVCLIAEKATSRRGAAA